MTGDGGRSAWNEDVAALRRGLQLAGVAVASAVVTAGLVIAAGTSLGPRPAADPALMQIAHALPATR